MREERMRSLCTAEPLPIRVDYGRGDRNRSVGYAFAWVENPTPSCERPFWQFKSVELTARRHNPDRWRSARKHCGTPRCNGIGPRIGPTFARLAVPGPCGRKPTRSPSLDRRSRQHSAKRPCTPPCGHSQISCRASEGPRRSSQSPQCDETCRRTSRRNPPAP